MGAAARLHGGGGAPLAPAVVWLLLSLLAAGVRGGHNPDDLIGWLGETHHDHAGTGRNSGEVWEPKDGKTHANPHIEVLSWEPRIFLYHNFLSLEECDHLMDASRARLARSGVVDNDTGQGVQSDVRSSSGTYLRRGDGAVVSAIEERMAEFSEIPAGQGEDIQILRYQIGEKYDPHFDYFFHKQGIDNGGNRIATILVYLEAPERGGETIFPNVKARPEQSGPEWTDCGRKGLGVRPAKGDAVLFFSLNTAGMLDKGSNHGSCPVVKGEKWAATKWIHVAHYATFGEKKVAVQHQVFRPPPPPAPPGCVDKNDACPQWAEGGECENNHGFMVGSHDRPGMCLLSCWKCDLSAKKLPGSPDALLRGGR